jgi:hypothetical protein
MAERSCPAIMRPSHDFGQMSVKLEADGEAVRD